jgi:hypothetical protein
VGRAISIPGACLFPSTVGWRARWRQPLRWQPSQSGLWGRPAHGLSRRTAPARLHGGAPGIRRDCLFQAAGARPGVFRRPVRFRSAWIGATWFRIRSTRAPGEDSASRRFGA